MINTIGLCKFDDQNYPKTFRDLKDMPSMIYYKGDISILNDGKKVAIIGSRKCSDKGLSFSHDAGLIAAQMGITVVNGLALGCDTEAIRGALSAGGKCVAIMAGGLDEIYPKSNERLADRIIECGGCIISEYETGRKPQKYTFVKRDRLQSALSQGVLVIEADIDSGTMHTVKSAFSLERRIAAYANAIVMLGGNKYAIDKGAKPITDEETLRGFYEEIGDNQYYEQMELKF